VPAEVAQAITTTPTAPVIQARTEPPFVIDTDLFKVIFQQPGRQRAQLATEEIAGRRQAARSGEFGGIGGDPYPFSLYMADHRDLAKKLNTGVFKKTVDPDGLGVTLRLFRWPHGGSQNFPVPEGKLPGGGDQRSHSGWAAATNSLEWRGGFGDFTIPTPAAKQQTIYFDLHRQFAERAGRQSRQQRTGDQ